MAKRSEFEAKKRRKSNKYRPWFSFALGVVRFFTRKRMIEGEMLDGPCVYLCRHRNKDGVIGVFAALPDVLRPWVLHTFTKYQKSIRHLREYTLTEKGKMSRFWAAILAPFCGVGITSLAKSARAIPVYRGRDGAMKSIGTIKASVRALEEGDRLLIFPDVDYANEEDVDDGEIYKGFIMVDKLYFRRNGTHVKFVPVYLSDEKVVVHPAFELLEGQEECVCKKIIAGIYNDQVDVMAG